MTATATAEGGSVANHETLTLQYESARAAEALYAGDLSLLRTLGDTLGVRVTTREGWIRFDGDPARVAQARRVFDQLERARQGGMTIRRHEFLYALRSVADAETADVPPAGGGENAASPTGTGGTNPASPSANSSATPPPSSSPAAAGRELSALGSVRIQTSARRPPVLAKTAGQLEYLRAIGAHDVVFGVGPAGTGKTYLAMAAALAALKREQVGRLILTRPAVEAGEALGFLPGDLQEKIFPYLRPLYDALHALLDPEELARYMEKRTVEIAPLAYMRGRTLDNAFIILDEAQNTTTEQMFMFLTRMGQGSKCVVTGDRTQIDLPANKRSGLVEAVQALKGVPGIEFVFFEETDIVRHELVQSIIRAYRRHRYGEGDGGGATEGRPMRDNPAGGGRRPKN